MKYLIEPRRAFSTLLLAALLGAAATFAQAPTPVPVQGAPTPPRAQGAPPSEKPWIPLKVQVTIVRYEGEKKTSSLPFTLWVNANNEREVTSLNSGQSVPIPMAPGSAPSIVYKDVGTRINITSPIRRDDGRFSLTVDISDSSLAAGKDSVGNVVVKSLSTHNSLLLRDGQTADFVAASDKVTGEVTRIDVTVSVLK